MRVIRVMAGYSSEDSDIAALVISPGTHYVQAGWAGSDRPRTVFPPVLGRPKTHGLMVGMASQDPYVGDEAVSKRGVMRLDRCLHDRDYGTGDGSGAQTDSPAVEGSVSNWDDFERILHHTFYNELRVAPEEQPCLLTEPVMNPNAARERMTQTCFEVFNTPALFLEQDSKLVLYSAGITTGLVVDLGHEQAHVTPYSPPTEKEGAELLAPPTKVAVNGAILTEELVARLAGDGVFAATSGSDLEIVTDIKEKLCCATTGPSSKEDYAPADYELPDGQIITVPSEIRCVANTFFDLSLLSEANQKWKSGAAACGTDLVSAIRDAADAAPHEMYANIVLHGGSSMFPDLAERIETELAGPSIPGPLKVTAPLERKYTAWIGGSVLASLSTMNDQWMTKQLYDEEGPALVTQRYPSGDAKFSSGSMVKAART